MTDTPLTPEEEKKARRLALSFLEGEDRALVTRYLDRHPLATPPTVEGGRWRIGDLDPASDHAGDLLVEDDAFGEPPTDAGLDVERLARALHKYHHHKDAHPDWRGCSFCSPMAEAIAREYEAQS